MVKTLTGRGIGSVGVLSATPYAVAIVAMVSVSLLSDRTGHRRLAAWPFLLLAAGAYLVGALGGSSGPLAAFAFLAACLLASSALMLAVRHPAAAHPRAVTPDGARARQAAAPG
jgi:hypothetical protein